MYNSNTSLSLQGVYNEYRNNVIIEIEMFKVEKYFFIIWIFEMVEIDEPKTKINNGDK